MTPLHIMRCKKTQQALAYLNQRESLAQRIVARIAANAKASSRPQASQATRQSPSCLRQRKDLTS